MEKEIGIEKLIELLNEYAKELGIGDYVGWHNKETVENSDYIFTKKFGFIKWLVENEKIDFSREGDLSNELVNLFGRKLDNAEGVIALLSIQDEPIRFLCEIIK